MPANKAVLEGTNDEKGTFVRTVSPSGVDHRLRELSLGADDDLISARPARFRGPGGSALLEKSLAAKGIESEIWNRIGD